MVRIVGGSSDLSQLTVPAYSRVPELFLTEPSKATAPDMLGRVSPQESFAGLHLWQWRSPTSARTCPAVSSPWPGHAFVTMP